MMRRGDPRVTQSRYMQTLSPMQSREEALRELKALGIVDQRGRCIAAIDSEAADA